MVYNITMFYNGRVQSLSKQYFQTQLKKAVRTMYNTTSFLAWEWIRNSMGTDKEWIRANQDYTRTPGNE
jgi:hypothetical protein